MKTVLNLNLQRSSHLVKNIKPLRSNRQSNTSAYASKNSENSLVNQTTEKTPRLREQNQDAAAYRITPNKLKQLDQGLNSSQKGMRQKNKIAISMTEIGERDNDEDEVDGQTTTNNRQFIGPNS